VQSHFLTSPSWKLFITLKVKVRLMSFNVQSMWDWHSATSWSHIWFVTWIYTSSKSIFYLYFIRLSGT
jgi:hypothetical protein